MNEYLPDNQGIFAAVTASVRYIYPELVLALTFLLSILADLFFSHRWRHGVLIIACSGLCLAAYVTINGLDHLPEGPVFNGMIRPTRLSALFKLVFYLSALLFLAFAAANRQIKEHAKGTGDLYAILLALVLGMNLMAMSSNLLMIYLSVEMVSVGSYLLVGYVSGTNRQAEAAVKYALFGATCSAIMLYGISLIYAFTGTLDLFDGAMVRGLQSVSPLGAGVALVLVLLGIGFKLSFVPAHFWSPDVYEGAPTPVTAFLSTGPKVAGFALLITFLSAFAKDGAYQVFDFYTTISGIAVVTMIAGNFSAIWQHNIKRMLAYSSIGHTGFMLMAVTAIPGEGAGALLFYSLVYTLMNMGAFMLADHIEERTGAITSPGYSGLGKAMPLVFVAFVIILVSLTGIPPTGGFFGKLLIFSAVWDQYKASGSPWALAMMITGAVTTVVSLFYYFRIPLNAWLRSRDSGETIAAKNSFLVYAGVGIMLLLVLAGIFPQLLQQLMP